MDDLLDVDGNPIVTREFLEALHSYMVKVEMYDSTIDSVVRKLKENSYLSKNVPLDNREALKMWLEINGYAK